MRTKKGETWLNRNGGEIKFNSFPDQSILLKTLEELAKLKIEIMFRAFRKDGKKINSSEKDRLLYDLLNESLVNRKLLPKNQKT
jgi:arsenate reductase-like glutaredoxin family protein